MESKLVSSEAVEVSRPNYSLMLVGVLALVFAPTVLVMVLNFVGR